MDLLQVLGSSMMATGIAVGALAGRSTYSQAIDFVEDDLKDKLRRLRLRTDSLRKYMVSWSIVVAVTAAVLLVAAGSLVFSVTAAVLLVSLPWYVLRRLAENRRLLIEDQLADAIRGLSGNVDAFVVLDQVEEPETGVVTKSLLDAIGGIVGTPSTIIGDSRRGLEDWPSIDYKMNLAEFNKLTGNSNDLEKAVGDLGKHHQCRIFVTLAEEGILSGDPDGSTCREATFPVRGEIDIVGAGDAVMANLAAALAASAKSREAMQLANAAASVVIHKLGTTGTATVAEIEALL